MNTKTALSSKRILVVDDDETLRDAIKDTLTHEGYAVTLAQGGRIGQGLLADGAFDAVISDIHMPDGDGMAFTKFTRASFPSLPVILISGFAKIIETAEASALGVKEFITKPFSKDDLLKSLANCFAPPPPEEVVIPEYCKIPLTDLICGKKSTMDLYIKLSDNKYIKIAHENELLPIDQIEKYKKRKVQYLYMQKSDLSKYIGINIKLSNAVIKASSISKDRKLAFMKHAMDSVLEFAYSGDIAESSLLDAKTILENTLSLMSSDDAALSLLEALSSQSPTVYAHSLAVSIYSVMIGRELQWHSPQTIHKLSMGALLHDIGEKELDETIVKKPRRELTGKELRDYETHCVRRLEILGSVQSVPSDILQIVQQHHEDCLGLGFPSNIKRSCIHPLAKVVAVADLFCTLAIKSSTSIGMNPQDAIERMNSVYAQKLDPAALGALFKIFKLPVPANLAEELRKRIPL